MDEFQGIASQYGKTSASETANFPSRRGHYRHKANVYRSQESTIRPPGIGHLVKWLK